MHLDITLDQIRQRCDVIEIRGESSSLELSGVATLQDAKRGDISFLGSAKNADSLASTKASAIFVPEGIAGEVNSEQCLVVVKNPSWEMARVCESIARSLWPKRVSGTHPSAVVDEGARVHESAFVGPHCVIEAGVVIGADCQIHAGCFIGENSTLGKAVVLMPRVTLYRDTVIGEASRLHSGVVIGADGFGLEFMEGSLRKIPQIGYVDIGDDVDIGANSCIDRGRLGSTKIGTGCRIDNHVQIGHNSQIGKHCTLCAQVGIAGTTTIEDYAVFGGRAGASGHVTIGKGAQVAGCSVAFSDLAGGGKYGGLPAISLNAYQRMTVLQQRLPDLFKRMTALEKHMLNG